MINTIRELKGSLQEKIEKFKGEELSMDLMRIISTLVDETLKVCRDWLSQEDFENGSSEIEFFKFLKPEIMAYKIEAIFNYNVSINEPAGTKEILVKYYGDELQYIELFFRRNAYHYQYYKNCLNELDQQYFLRNGGHLSLPIDDINDVDPGFSTPMSCLFAKFRAYEMIRKFLLQKITGEPMLTRSVDNEKHLLKWTGESINIVELAYGIHLSGQINNGNASLNEIVRWLESVFGVKIGIIQRRFSEIAKRKRLSQTKFIDQMKERIIEKIDAGNE